MKIKNYCVSFDFPFSIVENFPEQIIINFNKPEFYWKKEYGLHGLGLVYKWSIAFGYLFISKLLNEDEARLRKEEYLSKIDF